MSVGLVVGVYGRVEVGRGVGVLGVGVLGGTGVCVGGFVLGTLVAVGFVLGAFVAVGGRDVLEGANVYVTGAKVTSLLRVAVGVIEGMTVGVFTCVSAGLSVTSAVGVDV